MEGKEGTSGKLLHVVVRQGGRRKRPKEHAPQSWSTSCCRCSAHAQKQGSHADPACFESGRLKRPGGYRHLVGATGGDPPCHEGLKTLGGRKWLSVWSQFSEGGRKKRSGKKIIAVHDDPDTNDRVTQVLGFSSGSEGRQYQKSCLKLKSRILERKKYAENITLKECPDKKGGMFEKRKESKRKPMLAMRI